MRCGNRALGFPGRLIYLAVSPETRSLNLDIHSGTTIWNINMRPYEVDGIEIHQTWSRLTADQKIRTFHAEIYRQVKSGRPELLRLKPPGFIGDFGGDTVSPSDSWMFNPGPRRAHAKPVAIPAVCKPR